MNTAEIYLYNLKTKKGEEITTLCDTLKIAYKHVVKKEYALTLGVLTGIYPVTHPSKATTIALDITEEALFFKGFTSEMIGDFLKAYNTKGIATIPLKATLTAHNISWNSFQLIDELRREYHEFQK